MYTQSHILTHTQTYKHTPLTKLTHAYSGAFKHTHSQSRTLTPVGTYMHAHSHTNLLTIITHNITINYLCIIMIEIMR